MPQRKSKIISVFIAAIDCLILIMAFGLANYIKVGAFQLPHVFYSYLGFGWLALWLLVGLKYNLFGTPRVLYIDKILYQNFKAFLTFAGLSIVIVFFSTTFNFSRLYFLLFNSFFLLGILIWRIIFWQFFKAYRKNGHNYRKIALIGFNGNLSRIMNDVYLNPNFGYKIEGLFTDSKISSEFKSFRKGGLEKAIPFLDQNKVYEIVISLPHEKSEFINEILEYADRNLIRVKLIPEFSTYLSHLFSIDYVKNVPVMRYRKEPLHSFFNRFLKRVFDFSFSLFAILFIMSWLYPIIALSIKLNSKGPVLFKQKRTGKEGETFNCLKFRSMEVNEDSDKIQACRNDARITKVGAFLRKTSLDELPQLFNVLFNQMSLVGPRPHMINQTEAYKGEINNFMVRHFAKPGLTGWAQINGFRGETKQVSDMKNRVNADIWYIENWNFMLDIKIVFLTAWIVLFKKEENAF